MNATLTQKKNTKVFQRTNCIKLREAMALLSISASEMGRRLGVSESAVSGWLKADAMPPSIELACEYLLIKGNKHTAKLAVIILDGNDIKAITTIAASDKLTVGGREYFLVPVQ